MSQSKMRLFYAVFLGAMAGIGVWSFARSEGWSLGVGLAVVALCDLYVRWKNDDNDAMPFLHPNAGAGFSIIPLWICVIVAVLAFVYIRH